MKEDSAIIVNKLLKAWNSRQPSQILDFYAEEYQGEESSDPSPQYGKDGVNRMLEKFFVAFPDLQIQLKELVVENGKAAVYWKANGIHKGRIMNIPPTGKPVEVLGVSFLEFQEGLIIKGSHLWDMAGMLIHLGLLPKLPG